MSATTGSDETSRLVGVLVENDYQDMEVWVPVYRLREAGYRVDLIGPRAGEYLSKHGYPAEATGVASAVDPGDLAGIVIPGGWAPDRLRQDDGVLRLVQGVFERGAVVAAICHGGWVLASAGVARGKRVTCYRAIRDDMVHAGAEYLDAEVVRDDNLITSRTPDDIPAFCAAILQALEEQR
jgi:protease I